MSLILNEQDIEDIGLDIEEQFDDFEKRTRIRYGMR